MALNQQIQKLALLAVAPTDTRRKNNFKKQFNQPYERGGDDTLRVQVSVRDGVRGKSKDKG